MYRSTARPARSVVRDDVVQRADVGMIQRGDGAGFALEALTETLHRNFDGNVAVQASIASPVHLTHPAPADGSEDFMGAEGVPPVRATASGCDYGRCRGESDT